MRLKIGSFKFFDKFQVCSGRGKWLKMWPFLFVSSTVTKRFDFFSIVLKRSCPLDSKSVFVLVLAHLEPELELFEVDDIGDDGDDDL